MAIKCYTLCNIGGYVKKFISGLIVVMMLCGVIFYYWLDTHNTLTMVEEGISYNLYIAGDKFYQRGNQEIFLIGVNVGLGLPGYQPGSVAIDERTYLKWFKQIQDLGSNCIRVYTLQAPGFYQALYNFNRYHLKPLYLIQGAYLNEALIDEYEDVFASEVYADFLFEISNVVDACHGNADIEERKGHAFGEYRVDVSDYVISYLIGIEFAGDTVTTTNLKHPERSSFVGQYLHAVEGSSAFEVFLAQSGNYLIEYETNTYHSQRLLSFNNWPTSDPLDHPNEPEDKNNMAGFDLEHLKTTDSFIPGIYASYHVYPYYPDFLNYEDQSLFLHTSEQGSPYYLYLKRLQQHHTVPIVIAEFGVPTSRGLTHEDLTNGYDQGGLSEDQQGKAVISMLADIKKADMQGALIFSWQDEWFKRTWNTMELTDENGRAMWHDVQTSEANFGLMAFEPRISEYQIIQSIGEQILSVATSAEYLYVKVNGINSLKTKPFDIVFDVTNQSGIYEDQAKMYEAGVDFKLVYDGKQKAQLLVDSYYDSFNYLFGYQLNGVDTVLPSLSRNIGDVNLWQPINLRLRNRSYLPQDLITLEPSYYETGLLKYGVIDNQDKEYSLLNDFFINENDITFRIAWGLLNFSDPAHKKVLVDFYKLGYFEKNGKSIPTIDIEGISIAMTYGDDREVGLYYYSWDNWDEITYDYRFKKSYFMVKEYLKRWME